MARYELTDQEWERIAPLLPPTHTGKRGHPWRDHRPVLNAILWILGSGAPWADLPGGYPPRSTCNDRLICWQEDGTWERVLQALQASADQDGDLIWVNNALDATIVRVHQHAAGARRLKKRPGSGRTDTSIDVTDAENRRSRSPRGPNSLRTDRRESGHRTQSRRTDKQNSSARRRSRPADGSGFDGRSGTREHPNGGRAQPGSGTAPRSGSSPEAACPPANRQGIYRQTVPSDPAKPSYHRGHSDQDK